MKVITHPMNKLRWNDLHPLFGFIHPEPVQNLVPFVKTTTSQNVEYIHSITVRVLTRESNDIWLDYSEIWLDLPTGRLAIGHKADSVADQLEDLEIDDPYQFELLYRDGPIEEGLLLFPNPRPQLKLVASPCLTF